MGKFCYILEPLSSKLIICASRGRSGGQVRDEYRDEFDPGRGGYGRAYAEQFGEEH